MVRIKKPHKTNYFGGKLPDFRPLALYKHKDLTVHTEGDDDLVYDEMAPRQAGRPVIGNRCLQYVAGATITFESITGTLWGLTKVGGVWAWRDMTSLLSGLVLTMNASHTHYGAFRDDEWFMNCEEGFGTILRSNTVGETAPMSVDTAHTTQDDKPLLPQSGDVVGWSEDKITLKASSYSLANQTLHSTSTYYKRYNNGILRYPISTDNTGTPIVSTALGETAGLKSNYILVIITPQNTAFEAQRIDVLRTFQNANYSITLESNSNCYIYVLDLTLINAIAAYVASLADTYSDLRFLIAGNYTTVYLNSLKDWYDNNASYQAGLDAILDSYDAGLDYTTWYNYTSPFANMATAYISNGFALYYENIHNGAKATYTASSFVANASPGGNNALQWWINNSIPLKRVDVFRIYAFNPASGQNWYKLHGDFIKEEGILPKNKSSETDVKIGEPLEHVGPRDWPARVNAGGDLDLAYEFWNRPAAWDNYVPGVSVDDTVLERDNGGSIDRICVFENAPTNEQLTRAQRFTKDKV